MAAPSLIRRNQPRFGGERSGILQQTRLGGPMPWVIAIMIALTVMAAAAGLALSNVAGHARAEIAGGLTVQVVEAADAVLHLVARGQDADGDVVAARAQPAIQLADRGTDIHMRMNRSSHQPR